MPPPPLPSQWLLEVLHRHCHPLQFSLAQAWSSRSPRSVLREPDAVVECAARLWGSQGGGRLAVILRGCRERPALEGFRAQLLRLHEAAVTYSARKNRPRDSNRWGASTATDTNRADPELQGGSQQSHTNERFPRGCLLRSNDRSAFALVDLLCQVKAGRGCGWAL